ncbi:MAG: trypsin-like peptidase domain-containing protein, partial [Actinomycetes bacterium]
LAWTRLSGTTRTVALAAIVLVALRMHVASVKRSLLIAQAPDDPDDIAEAWTRELSRMILSMRRIAVSVTVFAGAAIYAIVKYTNLTTPKLIAAIGGVLLIWLFALARAFLELIMRRQGINRHYAEIVLSKWNRRRRMSLEAGSQPRVDRRYREFLDWAEAIGWMTHHPFLPKAEEEATDLERIRVETTPFAMEFRGARTRSKREFYSEAMRSKLFSQGWATLISNTVEADVAEQISRFGGGAQIGIFADTGSASNGPRRLFVQLLRDGKGRSIEEVPQCAALFSMIGKKNVDEWVDDCPDIPPAISSFENVDQLVADANRAAVWIHSWIGRRETVTGGVAVGPNLILTCRHPLGRPDRIEVRTYSGEVFDGELFRICEGADLALIRADGLDSIPAEIRAPGVAPQAQGDGGEGEVAGGSQKLLLGLGRSLTSEVIVGPVMGEVVATGRTINVGDLFARDTRPTPVAEVRFESEAGLPGMPVFDSAGAIAGIQTDASLVKQWDSTGSFLRLVVPGDIAHGFLADPACPIDNGLLFNRKPVGENENSGTPVGEFLGKLIHVPPVLRYMRPEHYTAGEAAQSSIAELWPKTIDWPVEVDSLASGEIGFGKNLRVVIHRVELTNPLVWSDLALIAEPQYAEVKPVSSDTDDPSASQSLMG